MITSRGLLVASALAASRLGVSASSCPKIHVEGSRGACDGQYVSTGPSSWQCEETGQVVSVADNGRLVCCPEDGVDSTSGMCREADVLYEFTADFLQCRASASAKVPIGANAVIEGCPKIRAFGSVEGCSGEAFDAVGLRTFLNPSGSHVIIHEDENRQICCKADSADFRSGTCTDGGVVEEGTEMAACLLHDYFCPSINVSKASSEECTGDFVQISRYQWTSGSHLLKYNPFHARDSKGDPLLMCYGGDGEVDFGAVEQYDCSNPDSIIMFPPYHGMISGSGNGAFAGWHFELGYFRVRDAGREYTFHQSTALRFKTGYVWQKPDSLVQDPIAIVSPTGTFNEALTDYAIVYGPVTARGVKYRVESPPGCEAYLSDNVIVNVMTFERGDRSTEDGQRIIADSVKASGTQKFNIQFDTPFDKTPVVLVTFVKDFGMPEGIAIAILDEVSATGFSGRLSGLHSVTCTGDDGYEGDICDHTAESYDFEAMTGEVHYVVIYTNGHNSGLFTDPVKYYGTIGDGNNAIKAKTLENAEVEWKGLVDAGARPMAAIQKTTNLYKRPAGTFQSATVPFWAKSQVRLTYDECNGEPSMEEGEAFNGLMIRQDNAYTELEENPIAAGLAAGMNVLEGENGEERECVYVVSEGTEDIVEKAGGLYVFEVTVPSGCTTRVEFPLIDVEKTPTIIHRLHNLDPTYAGVRILEADGKGFRFKIVNADSCSTLTHDTEIVHFLVSYRTGARHAGTDQVMSIKRRLLKPQDRRSVEYMDTDTLSPNNNLGVYLASLHKIDDGESEVFNYSANNEGYADIYITDTDKRRCIATTQRAQSMQCPLAREDPYNVCHDTDDDMWWSFVGIKTSGHATGLLGPRIRYFTWNEMSQQKMAVRGDISFAVPDDIHFDSEQAKLYVFPTLMPKQFTAPGALRVHQIGADGSVHLKWSEDTCGGRQPLQDDTSELPSALIIIKDMPTTTTTTTSTTTSTTTTTTTRTNTTTHTTTTTTTTTNTTTTLITSTAAPTTAAPTTAAPTTAAPTSQPPDVPPTVCNRSKVNLEFAYVQENTLQYCGEATCDFHANGQAQLAKQKSIRENLFPMIEKFSQEFNSVKIAYTEFCDKDIEPFGQAHVDFCYKFFNSLKPYDVEYREWIEDHWARKWSHTSSGRDLLENQLDATIATIHRANFSAGSVDANGNVNLRVMVMLTDKGFHDYGDVREAYPACKDDQGNELCRDYQVDSVACQCAGHEYPSVEQMIDVVSQNEVYPVFLLGEKVSDVVFATYESLNVNIAEASGGSLSAVVMQPDGTSVGFNGQAVEAAVEALCVHAQSVAMELN